MAKKNKTKPSEPIVITAVRKRTPHEELLLDIFDELTKFDVKSQIIADAVTDEYLGVTWLGHDLGPDEMEIWRDKEGIHLLMNGGAQTRTGQLPAGSEKLLNSPRAAAHAIMNNYS